MNTDGYDVIWDGSHGNRDADLLNPDLRIPDKVAQPEHPHAHVLAYHRMIDQVIAILRVTPKRTCEELVVLTGGSKQTVGSALYELRKRGMLVGEATEPRGFLRGRSPLRYWLTGEARS